MTNLTESNNRPKQKSCPDCNSIDLDGDVKNVAAVCNACGFVIHDFTRNHPAPVETEPPDETKTKSSRTWPEVSTVTNSTEQQIVDALTIAEDIADSLDVPKEARREAATLLNSASKQYLTDGRSTEAIVAATVYIAAKEVGEPRPLSRVAETVESTNTQTSRLTRILQRELTRGTSGADPIEYLPFLNAELEYGPEISARAERFLTQADTSKITNGRSPAGIAGAALYWASNGARTQQQVATAAGVSKETIRIRLQELRRLAEKDTRSTEDE